jgi:hypothetical protein
MKAGGSGKEFFPKTQNFRQWLWGVHSDIAIGFHAAERITPDALSKRGLLPPTGNHDIKRKKERGRRTYFFLGQEPLLQYVPCLPKP